MRCPHSPVTHLFPITCKSRLCPSCGYKYSMAWSENIQKHILNIEHRHVLFTVPEGFRMFFFYDSTLLSKFSAAVNKIFKFIFHNVSRKRRRKNKISQHSKYYFTEQVSSSQKILLIFFNPTRLDILPYIFFDT